MVEGLLERLDKYLTRGKVALFSIGGGTLFGYLGVPRILDSVKGRVYEIRKNHEENKLKRIESEERLRARYFAEELRKLGPLPYGSDKIKEEKTGDDGGE